MNSNVFKRFVVFLIAMLATFAFITSDISYYNVFAEEETTDTAEAQETKAEDAADELDNSDEEETESTTEELTGPEETEDFDYEDRLDEEQDADAEDIEALDFGATDEDTKPTCSKPKIVCPSKNSYITVNGDKVSVTNRVTINRNGKIFPVKFNRDYSYLYYSVKSGSESYISINSKTGEIKGLKATGSNKAYVTISATVDGQSYSKNCRVRVYKEKSAYAETTDVIKVNNTTVDAFKVEATAPCTGTGVVNDGSGKVTCKNITITKGKTKTVYTKKSGVLKPNTKVFTTSIKNKNIRKITVKLINNQNKNVSKKSSGKKLKGNKKGTIKYTVTVRNKKGKEYSSGECSIKVKKKSSSKKSATTKKKSSKKKTTKKSSKKSSKKKSSKKKTAKKSSKKPSKKKIYFKE